jgi:hypothetical protein
LAKVAVQSSAETFVVKFTTFAKPVNVVGSVFFVFSFWKHRFDSGASYFVKFVTRVTA